MCNDQNAAVDRGFETKVYKIGICCFSAKHTALRSKNKVWFARNQCNMYMSIRGLLLQ